MDINDIKCPKFAWILMIGLGCVDLIRGFIHTFLLEFAALNIFVIDMSGGVDNQIFLLGILLLITLVTLLVPVIFLVLIFILYRTQIQ